MSLLQKLQQKSIPIISGLCLIVAAVCFEVTENPTFSTIRERLNSIIYDIRMQITLYGHKPIDPSKTDIVIVDIDESSLESEGRWPWPRDKVTVLLNKIREGGASVIAFDIVFAEKQENLADEMIGELTQEHVAAPALRNEIKKFTNLFDYDSEFAQALAQKNDVVLGYVFTADPIDKVGALPAPILLLDKSQEDHVVLNSLPGVIANVQVIQDSAKHGGFVTVLTDSDGVIRRAPLVINHEKGIYPSLGLAAVMQYYYLDTLGLNFAHTKDELPLTSINLGNTLIPTDPAGQILLPYKGPSETFPYVSAGDLMKGKIDHKLISNKIVFIGTSAIGLGDLHATPFESSYPGVEMHATVADAILKNTLIAIPDWSPGAKIFVIVTLGLIMALLLPFLSLLWIVVIPLLVSAGVATGSLMLYTMQNIYLSSITIYLLMASLIIANLIYGYLFESRKREQLKEMFGQYVPPAHVEKMSESKGSYSFEGESRDMSVLFADIRDFTHISEGLEPTQLKKLLNEYFTPMTQIIFDNGGTIDKYVGDMIMAFWGAPLENKNHALDAVKAGFGMLKMAEIMSPQFKEMGVESIRIGVGINSGFMNVGDMGSKYRRSYTVLGDTVNLASRLESSTKFYHANFIISENTLIDCHGEVIARHLDRVKVIGKATAIEIYHPLCMKSEETPAIKQELETLKRAEAHYYQAEWDEALKIYEQLAAAHPDVGLYPLYIDRVNELKDKGVTAPWDGCYVRVTK